VFGRLVAGVFVVCAVLVIGVRWAAQSRTPPPTFLEPGACEQPCWQGLRPGVDTVDHFLYKVQSSGPYSGRTQDAGDSVVAMFELSVYGLLTLADVVRDFGPPERVSCLGLTHSTLFPGGTIVTAAEAYYADGLVVVSLVRPDQAPRLSPDMRVRTIRYYAPGERAYEIGTTTGWRGMGSSAVYPVCQPFPVSRDGLSLP
jgi:hypothetical protein